MSQNRAANKELRALLREIEKAWQYLERELLTRERAWLAAIRRTRVLQSAGMTTFALSVAGFVLAIVANVWTFVLTYVKWPRISVETHAHMFVGGDDQDKIVLVVINRGSEAATVSGIGLRPEEPSEAGRRDYEYDDLHHPDRLPESHHDPLPVRLEGHGALRWVYGPHQLEHFRDGTAVRGYAKVYRSFRRWRSHFTERTIDAPRTATIRR